MDCTCGECLECLQRAILEFGQRRDWQRFEYTPGTSISEGEQYWKLFVQKNSESVLRWAWRSITNQSVAK